MTPLAQFLRNRSPRLTEAGAERLAAKIIAEKAERVARKKAELAKAQPELPLKAAPVVELDDITVDF